ncbi:type IV pili methyl-accepting chemotaxis transducer N-terminal domain-containing protein [Marinobacter halophilus]|uniref:Pilus assembly protein PilP n=1 Tax=Marinobacter halophilus TaxID=1323740 RepID=A0A2T1KE72_9GAMM|nr:type IV pili methyl-accepting chemotaxis transducer N-terminal domain-containing protein [Marinobacter halophilus]PSF08426.1 pilus assembly protein PilP [Marinobacter halophilus]GGC60474.1 hypothetical protein GCM10011362_06200 [Marinobacter halophilus]
MQFLCKRPERNSNVWRRYQKQAISLVLMLTLSGALLALPEDNAAEILTIDSAINKAGKQRMLTQRITKSYMLIGQNVASDKAQRQLDASVALFEEQLGELERYSPTAEITKSLQNIRQEWNSFRGWAIARPERSQALAMIEKSTRLLSLCEESATLFEVHSGNKKGELINLSGRQRMLSQRIGMLYTAHSWQVNDKPLRVSFEQAISDFDEALQHLTASHINTDEINNSLDDVVAQWRFSHSGFQLSEDGRYVPFIIQVTTESILEKMEAITDMYESVAAQ